MQHASIVLECNICPSSYRSNSAFLHNNVYRSRHRVPQHFVHLLYYYSCYNRIGVYKTRTHKKAEAFVFN